MKTSEFEQDRFDSHFNDDLKITACKIIAKTYRETHRAVERLGMRKAFARRALPQLRHYLIQDRIKDKVKGISGVSTTIERHHSGNEYYAVIHSGNYFLTVSMVRERYALPRLTPFRAANSSLNNLFSKVKNPDDPDHDSRYAILAHVPSLDNRQPEFIDLLIPDSNYSSAHLVWDWMPLLDFKGQDIAAPREEIELPKMRLKSSAVKKVGGA